MEKALRTEHRHVRNKKGKTVMRMVAALLCALSIFGLGGCGKPKAAPEPEAVTTGGVTNKTDPAAPKTITSKEIANYYVNFMLDGEWSSGNKNVFYTFEVKPDTNGVLTASEAVTGVSAPADKALLDALQGIVDEYRLAEQNGVYKLTAGVDPSEFGPCTLTVNYASGEKLTFTVDNEPYAEWARATYLAFAGWFASQGNEALLPPDYESMIADITITFKDPGSGKRYAYGFDKEPDDEGHRVFGRSIDGKTERASVFNTCFFYDDVSRLVRGYDLRAYDLSSPLGGYERTEEDEKNPVSAALRLGIRFEDGHEISVATSAESVIEELAPLLFDLFDYFDELFPSN